MENKIRFTAGHPAISRYFTEWENPGCEESSCWRTLFDKGVFPGNFGSVPVSYVTDTRASESFWENMLSEACRTYPENSDYPMYLGVTLYAKGKKAEALERWKTAADMGNAYAWRNLAAYHANEKNEYKIAADMSAHALALSPDNRWLALDYASIVCASGDKEQIMRFLGTLSDMPENIRKLPRMKMFAVRAFLILERPEDAMGILTPDFSMPDIKEGELSASAMWSEMHTQYLMKTEALPRKAAASLAKERYPLPYSLDFRMHE